MNLFARFRRPAAPHPEQTVQVSDLLRGLEESVWVQTTYTDQDDKKDTSVFMNVFRESLLGHGETLSRREAVSFLANAVAYIHREEHDAEESLQENIMLHNADSPETLQVAEMIVDEALAASAAKPQAPAIAADERAPAL